MGPGETACGVRGRPRSSARTCHSAQGSGFHPESHGSLWQILGSRGTNSLTNSTLQSRAPQSYFHGMLN
jgi:hypothetical protein